MSAPVRVGRARHWGITRLPRRFRPRGLKIVRGWRAMPANTRGALLMLASCLVLTVTTIIVKLLGSHLNPLQVSFIRILFSLFAVLPFVLRSGRGALATQRLDLQLFRGMLNNVSIVIAFYAVMRLPLADSTAISFSRALFLIPLAMLTLKERVGPHRLAATLVGFIGVLIVVRPTGQFDWAALAAVAAALMTADASICVKILTRTDSTVAIIFYPAFVGTLLTAIPTALFWTWPTPHEYLLLLVMGVSAAWGQQLFIRSYAIAEASAVNPVDYSRILFSAVAGFLIFGDIPDAWTLTGSAIIVAATLYITRREALLARRGLAKPQVPPEA